MRKDRQLRYEIVARVEQDTREVVVNELNGRPYIPGANKDLDNIYSEAVTFLNSIRDNAHSLSPATQIKIILERKA